MRVEVVLREYLGEPRLALRGKTLPRFILLVELKAHSIIRLLHTQELVANHSQGPYVVGLVEAVFKNWIGLALVVVIDLHLGGHVGGRTTPMRCKVPRRQSKIRKFKGDLIVLVI